MKGFIKFALWVVGFVLLIMLIKLPLEEASVQTVGFSLPLSEKIIVLDPGHGGPDGGAVGSDKTVEKDIALAVSIKIKEYLQQAGATVYLTRETDTDLADESTKGISRRKSEDIRNRMEFINSKEADFFVTIHLNAIPSTKWRGAQTFYFPKSDEGKHLAKMIQAEITRNMENTNRSALAINNLYLLKNAEIPGALVEIGFLSNVEERELLKDENYQKQMAASIYEGILRYVTEEPEEEKTE
ncbi:N-acetylmuramoyl-L-alanine amidase CwlD [Ornithinibacillus bavariensis]|uniref:Germination-specific N-acetylmuramoyl-L-alanine amidase n=1 Tax=Ornithinibacillus bavariensis TaxID=545502 RepID=A0A920C7D7_9BACI|nr:N-acetylmuramoyl-L-alanine amidase CwlD [Ornithinibacillus bavariensis]GIO28735.1 germination-specific N-acetylmuramoyl-L-alanine amidase [Ornithinibacillus bavariensis]